MATHSSVLALENFRDVGAWWAFRLWGRTEYYRVTWSTIIQCIMNIHQRPQACPASLWSEESKFCFPGYITISLVISLAEALEDPILGNP